MGALGGGGHLWRLALLWMNTYFWRWWEVLVVSALLLFVLINVGMDMWEPARARPPLLDNPVVGQRSSPVEVVVEPANVRAEPAVEEAVEPDMDIVRVSQGIIPVRRTPCQSPSS